MKSVTEPWYTVLPLLNVTSDLPMREIVMNPEGKFSLLSYLTFPDMT